MFVGLSTMQTIPRKFLNDNDQKQFESIAKTLTTYIDTHPLSEISIIVRQMDRHVLILIAQYSIGDIKQCWYNEFAGKHCDKQISHLPRHERTYLVDWYDRCSANLSTDNNSSCGKHNHSCCNKYYNPETMEYYWYFTISTQLSWQPMKTLTTMGTMMLNIDNSDDENNCATICQKLRNVGVCEEHGRLLAVCGAYGCRPKQKFSNIDKLQRCACRQRNVCSKHKCPNRKCKARLCNYLRNGSLNPYCTLRTCSNCTKRGCCKCMKKIQRGNVKILRGARSMRCGDVYKCKTKCY